ncbi:RNase H domain-containing protein [Trichonephila clavipes]|uniref:RNase H domain-containing protein n=1 Tax=Trichonephila clavipes TaxID=2585209 RepID=A0A8X6UNL2_TRICX|nr:RNase H domain-containing protein [Trichonephila clavipes]
MADLPLKYEKNPKYLGFTLDLEFTSNRLVEALELKNPKSIWTLFDSRNAIQHLSNWSRVGDKTATFILNKLKQVSSSCDVHFQWIHSQVDVWGNEETDALAKEDAIEALATSNNLTYLELYSAGKHIDKKTWLVPLGSYLVSS